METSKTTILDTRNKQFDLMRAIGIVFVVWGHNYQPPFIFYPAFYFHMSLFFFISGYFFKPQISLKGKLDYLLKKTRSLLIPYMLFNLFFGILTLLLKLADINLGMSLNFNSLFYMPFASGDQFHLYLAAWFLFNLYFISIFAGLIYGKNIKVNIAIILIAQIIMLTLFSLNNRPDNSTLIIFIWRSFFGFAFFGLGYLFKLLEPRVQQLVINPASILVIYLVVNFLETNFGTLSYNILFGNITNKFFIAPIISSLCIILLVYTISFYGSKIFKKDSFIYQIGKGSFHIMIWHLTFFFLVNLILYVLSLIPFSSLSDVYFRYQIEKLWPLYQFPAIVFPILIAKGYHLIKGYLINVAFRTNQVVQ